MTRSLRFPFTRTIYRVMEYSFNRGYETGWPAPDPNDFTSNAAAMGRLDELRELYERIDKTGVRLTVEAIQTDGLSGLPASGSYVTSPGEPRRTRKI